MKDWRIHRKFGEKKPKSIDRFRGRAVDMNEYLFNRFHRYLSEKTGLSEDAIHLTLTQTGQSDNVQLISCVAVSRIDRIFIGETTYKVEEIKNS